jgi:hypothetical protein
MSHQPKLRVEEVDFDLTGSFFNLKLNCSSVIPTYPDPFNLNRIYPPGLEERQNGI